MINPQYDLYGGRNSFVCATAGFYGHSDELQAAMQVLYPDTDFRFATRFEDLSPAQRSTAMSVLAWVNGQSDSFTVMEDKPSFLSDAVLNTTARRGACNAFSDGDFSSPLAVTTWTVAGISWTA